MGLVEVLLTTLCFNTTCIDDGINNISIQRYQKLKEELRNETLTVTTIQNGPLSGYRRAENGTLTGTGVAFDIIHILQKEYGFKYVLKVPDDNVFQTADEDDRRGVRNMLLTKAVDVAAAFLPQQYGDTISYSRSLDTAQWVVLMKRPKESATGSGLLAPFTATVWTLIIISLLAVGPIMWLIVFLRARMCKEDHDFVFSLPSCMWFVYGALLKQGSTLNPKTDSSRILFSTWWIFITILTAFYTANLTAFLTLSKFTLPISEPKDITKKQYKWVTNRGNGIIEQLGNSMRLSTGDGNSLYEEIGLPKSQLDVEEETILTDYVKKQNYMYIREKTVLELVMYEDYKEKTKADIDEDKRCTYVITTFPVCVFPRSFAFKPNFKYKDLFDLTTFMALLQGNSPARFGRARDVVGLKTMSTFMKGMSRTGIQHLSESGITEFKQREFLPDTTICPLNLGSKERRLRNSDLAMTYMIVGGGLVISTVIFTIELILHYAKRHRCCQKHSSSINNNNINKTYNNTNQLFTMNGYNNAYNNSHYEYKSNSRGSKQFVSPPPPYHTLFNQPPVVPGSEYKKKLINGRQYWVINDKRGITSLIPQRAPSALLFQFTN